MNVFLTGATGYVGGAVAERLIAAGHAVTGLTRSEAGARALGGRGVSPLVGDLADLALLADAAGRSDGVIHAGFDPNDYQGGGRADEAGVGALLAALAAGGGGTRGTDKPFVYTSGTGVIGDTGGRVFGEATPFAPAPAFAWRYALERTVLAAAPGVRGLVLRPPLVYGRGGSFLVPALFALAAPAGVGRYIGTGENRWSTVHIEDLAGLYVLALEKAPAGTLVHPAAGPPVSGREMARAVSRSLGAGDRAEPATLEEAAGVIGFAAYSLAADVRLSSEAAPLLGWEPRAPSVLDDITHGSYTANAAAAAGRTDR